MPSKAVNSAGAQSGLLDRGPGMPLYQQMFMILRNRIESGEIPAGAILPGELELSAEFDVSRITCRRALNDLADAGLVARQRGVGTRVLERGPAGSPIVHVPIDGWRENVSVMSETTQAVVLDFEYVAASPEVSEALEIDKGTVVQRAVRVRWRSAEPMSYLLTFVPEDIGRRYAREDLGDVPLIRLLENAGVTVESVWQSISATLADPEIAFALQVSRGSPLIEVRRIARDGHGRPVEYIRIYYRPDRYRLEMVMERAEGRDGMTWSQPPRSGRSGERPE